jgi:hypothetical protein
MTTRCQSPGHDETREYCLRDSTPHIRNQQYTYKNQGTWVDVRKSTEHQTVSKINPPNQPPRTMWRSQTQTPPWMAQMNRQTNKQANKQRKKHTGNHAMCHPANSWSAGHDGVIEKQKRSRMSIDHDSLFGRPTQSGKQKKKPGQFPGARKKPTLG